MSMPNNLRLKQIVRQGDIVGFSYALSRLLLNKLIELRDSNALYEVENEYKRLSDFGKRIVSELNRLIPDMHFDDLTGFEEKDSDKLIRISSEYLALFED